MGGQHYYTIASLPFLKQESNPPFSSDEYIERCSFDCSEEQIKLLRKATLNPTASGMESKTGTILDDYWSWEKNVRNTLVKLRAKNLGKEASTYLQDPQSSPEVNELTETAFREKSPLAAEKILDSARWKKIEELKAGHLFDFSALLAYKLQLEILQRNAQFDQEKGFDSYRKLYEKIMANTDNDITFGEDNGKE